MSKAGRKRKQQVEREANGRQQRESVDATKRPVLSRRCRMMGWPDTDENRRVADQASMATLYGRLSVAKTLSARAAMSIQGYVDLVQRYRRAIENPGPVKGSAMGDMPAKGSVSAIFDSEGHAESVRRTTNAYKAAEGALIASGGKAAVIWAIEQPETVCPLDVPYGVIDMLEKAGKALEQFVRVEV